MSAPAPKTGLEKLLLAAAKNSDSYVAIAAGDLVDALKEAGMRDDHPEDAELLAIAGQARTPEKVMRVHRDKHIGHMLKG